MPIPYLYPTSFPYGSRVVTFSFSGGGSASVILEAFEPSEGTFEINRQNELGAPNGVSTGTGRPPASRRSASPIPVPPMIPMDGWIMDRSRTTSHWHARVSGDSVTALCTGVTR